MLRILVTGKEGQLDTSLQKLADHHDDIKIIRIGLPEVDLSRPETLDRAVLDAHPDLIISSAAYTAVDRAESEEALAQRINGDGPGRLAQLAAQLDIPILHMSTDYVFAGDKAQRYDECDQVSPINAYGRTKLSGEEQVQAATSNHVILRTAWVYSPYGNNFVKTMLRLGETREEIAVVEDQFGCPTYAPEIARALLQIARKVAFDRDRNLRGIFHLTGRGETNWSEFARAIFLGAQARGRKAVTVKPIPAASYPSVVNRPSNSRLSGEKLANVYGIQLDPWQTSLDACLDILLVNGE